MSDSFKDRGGSFEAKYAHDAEFQFKAHARRNKLVGLWVSEQIGLDGKTAEAYAKTVVLADFEEPGDGDVIRKVLGDLAATHPEITEKDIVKKLEEFLKVAVQQLTDEAK